jgi:hypothetical protein
VRPPGRRPAVLSRSPFTGSVCPGRRGLNPGVLREPAAGRARRSLSGRTALPHRVTAPRHRTAASPHPRHRTRVTAPPRHPPRRVTRPAASPAPPRHPPRRVTRPAASPHPRHRAH